MWDHRIYNFSAGPANLPEEVLRETAEEMLNYRGCGMSVMEMSHRSSLFQVILEEAKQDLRDIMGIPDNYKILFIQGGGMMMFSMIPLNLMYHGMAEYILTGQWAKKAWQEAAKYGNAYVAASSEDKQFSFIPDCSDLPIHTEADYVYICENNTIFGTKYQKLPNTKGKTLVADVSSCFLSEPVDISRYGLLFGGVQKNVGPAGTAIVIIREDLIKEPANPQTPVLLSFKTHADHNSLYNTPNCFGIYVCGKVFQWIKREGGLVELQKKNQEKAEILYHYLDQSRLFHGTARPEDRSLMNVPFTTGQKELDERFVKEAEAAGFANLKGHRIVGGMRASIFNAMPKKGVEELVYFMEEFEKKRDHSLRH